MKRLLIFFGILTVAVFFIMAVSSVPDAPSRAPGASGGPAFTNSCAIRIPAPGRCAVAVVSIRTNSPAMPQQTNFARGVYAAKPYSMIVGVPPAIDEKMIVAADNPDPQMPAITPELHLEKR
ncbi:MAG TPA: hypothetical protein VF988_13070 [Verrucomicrobiae bacterium]